MFKAPIHCCGMYFGNCSESHVQRLWKKRNNGANRILDICIQHSYYILDIILQINISGRTIELKNKKKANTKKSTNLFLTYFVYHTSATTVKFFRGALWLGSFPMYLASLQAPLIPASVPLEGNNLPQVWFAEKWNGCSAGNVYKEFRWI